MVTVVAKLGTICEHANIKYRNGECILRKGLTTICFLSTLLASFGNGKPVDISNHKAPPADDLSLLASHKRISKSFEQEGNTPF